MSVKLENYLKRRTLENFKAIKSVEQKFIYEKITEGLETTQYVEKRKVIFNKTVDFFLFGEKEFSVEFKNGIKSFLYSKKLLYKNYNFYIVSKNTEILVKLKDKKICFNFENKKILVQDTIEDICNFFIKEKIIINKIYYKLNDKILFIIYDIELGLCNFSFTEYNCYKINRGLLYDDEKYSDICKDMIFPDYIQYSPLKISICKDKYFDEKLFPYYIDNFFYPDYDDNSYITDSYDHKILCNDTILTSQNGKYFKISNGDFLTGLFHVSKNERYIYILRYGKQNDKKNNYVKTQNEIFELKLYFKKLIKYDRQTKKEIIIFDFKNVERIFRFYISDNELFLLFLSDQNITILNRNNINSEFKLLSKEKHGFPLSYDLKHKNFEICDSNSKYFVYVIFGSNQINLNVYDMKTFKKINFTFMGDNFMNSDLNSIKLIDNKIIFYTQDYIFNFKIGTLKTENILLEQYKNYDYFVLDESQLGFNTKDYKNSDRFLERNKLTDEEVEELAFLEREQEIEYLSDEDEFEREDYDDDIDEKAEKINYIKNLKNRRKALDNEKIRSKLQTSVINDNNFNIHLTKYINIYPFLGIRISNNKLINCSLSNNGDMFVLIYDSKHQIVKEGDYFMEYKKTEDFFQQRRNTKVFKSADGILNKNVFLIDKNYKIHFLTEDIYEKIGWFPEYCVFSSDDNKLLFIEKDEVYTFDISYINKRRVIENSILNFGENGRKEENPINKFTNDITFDKNLLDIVYRF